MATSVIKSNGESVVHSRSTYTAQAVDTWEYTGLSITIPANCSYIIKGFCMYSNHPANGSGFSTSVNEMTRWYTYVESNSSYCSTCGVTDSALTLYLFGKWSAISSNGIGIDAVIKKLQ